MVKRLPLLFLSLIPGAWANTTVLSLQPTSEQALLQVRTDQGFTSCSFKLSEVNNFGVGYLPVIDADDTVFPGANLCPREGNIINANVLNVVFGKRTVELAADGKSKKSRALGAARQFYYQLIVGSDTVSGNFRTQNIKLGITRNDVRFDRNAPGEYAYPTMDWTIAGKNTHYIDPFTGSGVRRLSGPGEIFPVVQTRTFDTPTGTGWTGGTWTGTGVSPYLKMRETDPDPSFRFLYQSVDAVQLVVPLSGTVPGVDVCFTNNQVVCTSKVLTQTGIMAGVQTFTIGGTTPILDDWKVGTAIPSTLLDFQPMKGTITKVGTKITWTDPMDGNKPHNYFNLNWIAGSLITLDGTDCTISSVTNEKELFISSAGCKADGVYDYVGRNWGILLRTTGTGTVTVGTPTWKSYVSGSVQGGASGIPRICQQVHIPSPAGVLCWGAAAFESFSDTAIFWLGDDGTTRLIAPSYALPTGTSLTRATCGGDLYWDTSVIGKYWCSGIDNDGHDVLYSITYNGDYSAITIPLDAYMASAIVKVESTDLDAMVTDFTKDDLTPYAPFAAKSTNHWAVSSNQNGKIVLNKFLTMQDTPSWNAVFDPALGRIVAAGSTYGGGDVTTNRWCADHTPNWGGNTNWWFLTCNEMSALKHASQVSSGTLTSTFATCPANIVNVSLIGTPACSQITLASITPTCMAAQRYCVEGESFFNQPYRLGDEAIVQSNNAPDGEIVRILTIAGNVVWVQRNARPYVYPYDINTDHTGVLSLYASPGAWHEYWWNFLLDPHYQTIYTTQGATVVEDPMSSNCHEAFENEVFIEGCVKFYDVVGKVIRLLQPWLGFANPSFVVNPDAAFAASTFHESANQLEQHPSIGQRLADAWERAVLVDNRPYLGNLQATMVGNVTHVSGDIYKVSAAGTADFNYRTQGLVGMTGGKILVDVSPAIITQAMPFQYCYVVNAGDCFASSLVGEIYVNVPQLGSMNAVTSRFIAYPDNTFRDLTFTQNTFTWSTAYQAKVLDADPYGINMRRLSTFFAPAKVQSEFWNSQVTTTNTCGLGAVRILEFVRNEYMCYDVPSWPNPDSTNRGVFVNLPLGTGGTVGVTVRVRFGYAENGTVAKLLCHERQVACSTDATKALPYTWTDEGQNWQTCGGKCVVSVPVIAGRMLYYVVDRKFADGTVVSSEMEVTPVS